MSDRPPILRVEDLSVSYRTPEGRRQAVDHLSFEVARGEIFGLVGESGSGKSSTAFAILGLIKPPGRVDGGRIVLGDTDLRAQSGERLRLLRWREMSLVPQGAMNALNPVMRVGDQIRDVIETHEGRVARDGMAARIAQLFDSVGLSAAVGRSYPHELSGGMKQRVCVAMAVALHPSLIIADEPTSALDVVVQRAVAETIKSVQSRLGVSVILIGHDLGLQAQLVDRLAVMYRGRLVEVGPTRALFHRPQHPYTELLVSSAPSIRSDAGQSSVLGAGARARELAEAADRLVERGLPPLRAVGPDHLAALP